MWMQCDSTKVEIVSNVNTLLIAGTVGFGVIYLVNWLVCVYAIWATSYTKSMYTTREDLYDK